MLRLDEEFDLADAAAPKLHIMSAHSNIAMTLMGVNLPLDRVHIGDSGIVEIFAPNIGREFRQNLLAGFAVPCNGPRLDHGSAFPVLTTPFVIMKCSPNRNGERRGPRIGPQTKIDTENIAVAGTILQNADKAARQPREGFDTFIWIADRRSGFIDKDDEINIGRIIEFPRTELAHAEHDPSTFLIGMVAVGKLDLACTIGIEQQKADGSARAGLGQIGQPACCCLRIKNASEIAKRNQHMRLAFQYAQAGHERGFRHVRTCSADRDFRQNIL